MNQVLLDINHNKMLVYRLFSGNEDCSATAA
jgi:hypothetical protein